VITVDGGGDGDVGETSGHELEQRHLLCVRSIEFGRKKSIAVAIIKSHMITILQLSSRALIIFFPTGDTSLYPSRRISLFLFPSPQIKVFPCLLCLLCLLARSTRYRDRPMIASLKNNTAPISLC
jgi:hypothetical protein